MDATLFYKKIRFWLQVTFLPCGNLVLWIEILLRNSLVRSGLRDKSRGELVFMNVTWGRVEQRIRIQLQAESGTEGMDVKDSTGAMVLYQQTVIIRHSLTLFKQKISVSAADQYGCRICYLMFSVTTYC